MPLIIDHLIGGCDKWRGHTQHISNCHLLDPGMYLRRLMLLKIRAYRVIQIDLSLIRQKADGQRRDTLAGRIHPVSVFLGKRVIIPFRDDAAVPQHAESMQAAACLIDLLYPF